MVLGKVKLTDQEQASDNTLNVQIPSDSGSDLSEGLGEDSDTPVTTPSEVVVEPKGLLLNYIP